MRATDTVDFSEWLRGAGGEAEVPCGGCTACCRSSMFIHIGPEETQTLRRIPRALLFPAPGLPTGHKVMGYNERGHCPMLVDDKCSIYEHRPQTCRRYDCRIFAATGVAGDAATQPDIVERVKAWVFRYDSEESRDEHVKLRASAAGLAKDFRGTPTQLAVLAVTNYRSPVW